MATNQIKKHAVPARAARFESTDSTQVCNNTGRCYLIMFYCYLVANITEARILRSNVAFFDLCRNSSFDQLLDWLIECVFQLFLSFFLSFFPTCLLILISVFFIQLFYGLPLLRPSSLVLLLILLLHMWLLVQTLNLHSAHCPRPGKGTIVSWLFCAVTRHAQAPQLQSPKRRKLQKQSCFSKNQQGVPQEGHELQRPIWAWYAPGSQRWTP